MFRKQNYDKRGTIEIIEFFVNSKQEKNEALIISQNMYMLRSTIKGRMVVKGISKTRKHSSRMRTGCSSSHTGGGLHTPRDQAPPGTRHPPPGPGTPIGQAHTCKNITFVNFGCGW